MRITPPLKIFGGKYPMASLLYPLAAPHIHRVHPFGGALGEFWNWRSEGVSEVVNDIDRRLTNFFRVLQNEESFNKFYRQVECIPFSEVEWLHYKNVLSKTKINGLNIDAAVAFFVVCRQSIGGRCSSFAPLSRSRVRRGMNEQVSAWLTAIAGLKDVHNRLLKVVIKNKRAIDLIIDEDSPGTLFYLDPPYLHETRTGNDEYRYEMTHNDHENLLKIITGTYDYRLYHYHNAVGWAPSAQYMLSGYDNELYNDYLSCWTKIEINRPNSAAGGSTKRIMTECVWVNYPMVNNYPVVLYNNFLK